MIANLRRTLKMNEKNSVNRGISFVSALIADIGGMDCIVLTTDTKILAQNVEQSQFPLPIRLITVSAKNSCP